MEDLSSYYIYDDFYSKGAYCTDISSREISMNLKAYKYPLNDC